MIQQKINEIHVLIDDITVSELMSFDENYMKHIKSLFDDAEKSLKRAWLKEHRIKINRLTVPDRNTMTVRTVFYANLSEKQATEFYLRFQ